MALVARMLLPWGGLLAWSQWHRQLNCLGLLLCLSLVIAVLALDMLEVALLKRRALVGMYLKPESGLYRLLRGGPLMLIWQVGKALILAVILLAEATQWTGWLWLVLGLDALLLAGAYPWYKKRFATQVKAGHAETFARQYLVILNILLLTPLIAGIYFYTPHPDYRELGWRETLLHEASRTQTGCSALAAPAKLMAAKNALGWWLAQTWLQRLQHVGLTALGWLLFLLGSAAFVWAYSRLILGMSLSPPAVLGRFSET